MSDEGEIIFSILPPSNITEISSSATPKEILRLTPNGDIYVNGRLAENDKQVVDGLREFLRQSGEV